MIQFTESLLPFDFAFAGLPSGFAACYDKHDNKNQIERIERCFYESKVCLLPVSIGCYCY